MIKSKSPSQWQELYRQHEISGLSISKFCKQEKISTYSFYLHRDNQDASNNFIQAKVTNHQSQSISVQTSVPSSITLNTTAGILSLPLEIQPSFLIKLLKGLA